MWTYTVRWSLRLLFGFWSPSYYLSWRWPRIFVKSMKPWFHESHVCNFLLLKTTRSSLCYALPSSSRLHSKLDVSFKTSLLAVFLRQRAISVSPLFALTCGSVYVFKLTTFDQVLFGRPNFCSRYSWFPFLATSLIRLLVQIEFRAWGTILSLTHEKHDDDTLARGGCLCKTCLVIISSAPEVQYVDPYVEPVLPCFTLKAAWWTLKVYKNHMNLKLKHMCLCMAA